MDCILGNSICQNTLTSQVSQLWKKTVEEESQNEAEQGDGETDGVDEVLDHGLHVNLKVKEI
jgi:hypothetical protein